MTERLSTKYIRYVFNVRMFYYASNMFSGLPWWLGWQRFYLQCQRLWFDPWVRMIPWRRGMVYPLQYSYLEYSLDNVENFKDLVKPIEEYKNHP